MATKRHKKSVSEWCPQGAYKRAEGVLCLTKQFLCLFVAKRFGVFS